MKKVVVLSLILFAGAAKAAGDASANVSVAAERGYLAGLRDGLASGANSVKNGAYYAAFTAPGQAYGYAQDHSQLLLGTVLGGVLVSAYYNWQAIKSGTANAANTAYGYVPSMPSFCCPQPPVCPPATPVQ